MDIAWLLSDGRAGHEAQSLAIAEALGLEPDVRRISPRRLFALAAPFGPADPCDAPLLAPPFPDLVIACGRRTIPYLRRVKRLSGGRAFTVYINAPATGLKTADVIVAPCHDELRGPNVVAPFTPPNRLTPELLAATRACPDPRVAALPGPRAALLIGGTSRHFRFGADDATRLAALARQLLAQGYGVAATASRRTPPEATRALRAALRGAPAFLWDGSGENPYLSMLALAQGIVVTADSVNMIGEAVATGAPVHVFEPTGGHGKIAAYLDALEARGAVRRWRGALEHWSYEPLNSTRQVADEIARAHRRFRQSRPGPRAEGCGAAHIG